jgi:hypothetical protein
MEVMVEELRSERAQPLDHSRHIIRNNGRGAALRAELLCRNMSLLGAQLTIYIIPCLCSERSFLTIYIIPCLCSERSSSTIYIIPCLCSEHSSSIIHITLHHDFLAPPYLPNLIRSLILALIVSTHQHLNNDTDGNKLDAGHH